MRPIESMIEICNQAMTDKNYALAGQMAKELAQYVYPKRKAVEHITDEPAECLSLSYYEYYDSCY